MSHREKICIYVDYSSFATSIKMDFRLLRDWLASQREVSWLKFYWGWVSKSELEAKTKFCEVLARIGYEIYGACNPRSTADSGMSDPVISELIHAEMIWDMCRAVYCGHHDTFVIVSSSAAIADVVTKIRRLGIDVEVAFPENLVAPALRSRATIYRPFEFYKFSLEAV